MGLMPISMTSILGFHAVHGEIQTTQGVHRKWDIHLEARAPVDSRSDPQPFLVSVGDQRTFTRYCGS